MDLPMSFLDDPPPTVDLDELPDPFSDRLQASFPIPPAFRTLLFPSRSDSLASLHDFVLPPIDKKSFDVNAVTFIKELSVSEDEPDKLKNVLTSMPSVPFMKLEQLYERAVTARRDGFVGLAVNNNKMPMWAMAYWYELEEIRNAKKDWESAEAWLKENDEDVLPELKEMPWGLKMPEKTGTFTQHLAVFCSDRWISDEQLNLVAWMLQRVLDSASFTGVSALRVVGPFFVCKLISAYRNGTASYLQQPNRWLRRVGDLIATGEVKTVAFNAGVQLGKDGIIIPGKASDVNHWVTVKLDMPTMMLGFGDSWSEENELPEELRRAIEWWLEQHGRGSVLLDTQLVCSVQRDSVSCGILAANCLLKSFYPARFPALDSSRCSEGRIWIFLAVLRDILRGEAPVSHYPIILQRANSSSSAMVSVRNGSSSDLRGPSKDKTSSRDLPKSVSVSKNRDSEPSKSNIPKAKGKQNKAQTAGNKRTIQEAFLSQASKPNTNQKAGTGGESEAEEVMDEGAETAGVVVGKVNTAPNPVLKKITGRAYDKSKPGKRKWFYWCKTPGCSGTLANLNKSRWLAHAYGDCPGISPDLKEVGQAMMAVAPSKVLADIEGTKVEGLVDESKDGNIAGGDGDGNSDGENGEPPVKKFKMEDGRVFVEDPDQPSVAPVATKTGRQIRHARLNLAITQLFCIAGLPPFLASRPEWTRAWQTADPTYNPQTKDTLTHNIQSESALCHERQLGYLKTRKNLTFSCDGGTSRGRDSFWNAHVATGDGDVYKMATLEATAVSHDANWILNSVSLPVIDDIGRNQFAGVVCDSTGNTRAFRRLLVQEIPTIIELPDTVHHLNLLVKDLVRVEHFKEPIAVDRMIIQRFHKSHSGAAELAAERQNRGISRGLEGIGKTRFGGIVHAAISVQRCNAAIQAIVKGGTTDCEDFADYMGGSTLATAQYDVRHRQFISVGHPIVTTIRCLEATQATCADVFVYWHALVYAVSKALENERNSEMAASIREEIMDKVAYRYNQLFGQNPALGSPVFLAAAYLNPGYMDRQSGIFCEDRDNSKEDYRGIHSVNVFVKVLNYLHNHVALPEVKKGVNPLFTDYREYGAQFSECLKHECIAYARRRFPYDGAFDINATSPQEWWERIHSAEPKEILPVIALKIYALRPNSMAEERTVSNFTWITPPVRNRMSVATMSHMTTVRQYYKANNITVLLSLFGLCNCRYKLLLMIYQSQTRKSNPQPILKYYQIVRAEKESLQNTEDTKPLEEEEEDRWIDERTDDDNEVDKESPGSWHRLIEVVKQFVDLESPYLHGLLTENRVGTNAGRKTAVAVKDSKDSREADLGNENQNFGISLM
ncbi:hypothetical protein AAF712_004054 [Marasmius tenuissimus]|uniref:Ubiquitin-like protease family profile domain-containing protein n=1 Tax=Marasmius tenuissimus TaxID=585030 RepID=A0ABR3A5A2_9AGAR